jgi:cytochrome P450
MLVFHGLQMDMVLNETMRFIPPVAAVFRDAIDTHQIGSMTIAAGTNVIIPLSVLNHNKEVWGNDAHLFNPGRWDVKNGANHFKNFMPFGGGNRICLGRNLARVEAKLLLSVLLRRFTFSVAPGYMHSPGVGDVVLWPKFGAQLRIKNVDSYTSLETSLCSEKIHDANAN